MRGAEMGSFQPDLLIYVVSLEAWVFRPEGLRLADGFLGAFSSF
jgi:hypothetical protein